MPLFLRNILWSPCKAPQALHDHVYQKIKIKNACLNFGEKEKKGRVGSEFPDSDIHSSVFSKGLAHFSKCAKLLQVLQRHASVQMLHISTASWNVYFINSLNIPPVFRPRSQLCVLGWGVTMIHATTLRVYANFTKSKAWSAIQVYFRLPHLSKLDC